MLRRRSRDLHRGGVHGRQHQRDVLPCGGADRGEDVGPEVAELLHARPLATAPPAVADPALVADPSLVGEPQLDPLVDDAPRGGYLVGEPPFLKAACARRPAEGPPSGASRADAAPGSCSTDGRSPYSASSQRQRSARVQAQQPPRRGPARARSPPREPPPPAPRAAAVAPSPVVKPAQPLGVVAHHRVAQRLPLHAGKPRRLGPAQPVERVRDRVHPRRRPPVLLAACLPPQRLRRQLVPLECFAHRIR